MNNGFSLERWLTLRSARFSRMKHEDTEKIMKKLLSSVALAAAFVVAGPLTVIADDTWCVGAMGAGPYDNVIVPAGATCTLTNTIVTGSVKVEPGAKLYVFDAVISGNLQSDGAHTISVLESTVSVTGDT